MSVMMPPGVTFQGLFCEKTAAIDKLMDWHFSDVKQFLKFSEHRYNISQHFFFFVIEINKKCIISIHEETSLNVSSHSFFIKWLLTCDITYFCF